MQHDTQTTMYRLLLAGMILVLSACAQLERFKHTALSDDAAAPQNTEDKQHDDRPAQQSDLRGEKTDQTRDTEDVSQRNMQARTQRDEAFEAPSPDDMQQPYLPPTVGVPLALQHDGPHVLSRPHYHTALQSPSLRRYLDSYFQPQQATPLPPSLGRDFSVYGFYTPSDVAESKKKTAEQQPSDTLDPDEPGNLFDRMRAGFRLDLSSTNPRLEQQFRWYVKNPSYLDRTFARSARYLHHIVEQLEAHDMPLELALLPLVESAYDPFAYSHGRAAGLWQFIPGTGRIYGLHQNWWVDGRRDVLASTQAAIDYLQYLNRRFDGNWLHALAAYNSGSGRVSGAIKRNRKAGKPTDFWSLKLPRETRAYVPKLLAIAKLVAHPERYGIALNPIPDKPYFAVVDIGTQMDLAHAAELAQIDIKELYKLNPGFNQWATDPQGPHRLLVPQEKAEIFRQALAELDPKQRITWQRYTVRSGDSLIKIAKRHHTTPQLVQQVNKLRGNLIRVGQKLLIPVASKQHQYYDLNEANRLANKQARFRGQSGSSKIIHHVQAGDTLWDLARAHKVSTRSIAKWNGRAPGDVLKPGQKLVIWSRAEINAPQTNTVPRVDDRQMIKRVGYRVRKGDSLARIASKFNVSIKDLINWNKLDQSKYLQPGQKLTIFVDITST